MLNKNLFNGAVARAGLTHKELSKRIGISKNSLCSKVNGRSVFNVNEIDKICIELKIVNDSEKAQIFLSNSSQNRDIGQNLYGTN